MKMGNRDTPIGNRHLAARLLGCWLLAICCCGCLSPWMKHSEEPSDVEQIEDLFAGPDRPRLVRDAAVSMGMNSVKLESIAVVNGLHGTGGIPEPSRQRDALLDELKTMSVKDPNKFLDSKQSAMVSVEAVLPPGVQKNDPIDLFVRISTRSSATNLRGGWLMPTRLKEMRMLNNQMRSSEMLAKGVGRVVVRQSYDLGDKDALVREGVIPSGGRCAKSRSLGLVIRPAYQHAFISAQIAKDVNRRFFFFDGTSRRGIANAKEDDFIELSLHPTYRRNVYRFMSVIQAIAVNESLDERHARLDDLKRRLTEPSTAADAAIQMEGIGEEAVEALKMAATVANAEIRFYTAEALAYMDEADAIDPLTELARNEPAFRYRALLALSIMEHRLAAEALRSLMDEASVETRYGAFHNLRQRADRELIVPGVTFSEEFAIYQVASRADPLVVVSTAQDAEVVVFGGPIAVAIPDYLMTTSGLMVKRDADTLRVSCFRPGKPDARANVQANVSALVKGIVDVGGDYSDVIEVLRLAKQEGYLQARFAIDPLPKTERTYHRQSDESPDVTQGSTYDTIGPENIDAPEPEETKSSWWSF